MPNVRTYSHKNVLGLRKKKKEKKKEKKKKKRKTQQQTRGITNDTDGVQINDCGLEN